MDLLGIKWKLATGAAAVSLLVVSGLLTRSYIENRRLLSEVAKLDDTIENPKTGLRVRLATETANRANLEAATEKQTAALKQRSTEDAAKLADARRELAAAQKATRAAEKQVAVMLATPPKGDTLAERMADVDARVLESLQ